MKGVSVLGARTHGRLAVLGATAVAVAAMTAAGGAFSTAAASSTAAAGSTAPARTAAAGYTPPKRTLQEGMKGADVKALQQRLAALKYYPGPVDGAFGNDTLEAVWAFQEVNGISATGVVATATKNALVHPRTYKSHDPRQNPTRIEVNLTVRVLIFYRNGKIWLISHVSSGGGYWYPCSGGGQCKAVTPTGNFRTTVFMPGWVKVPLGEMYNPVFFISTVYAIHGDTFVPVYPASHGCIRIPMDVAAFFHKMVKTPGTEVFVYK